MRVGELMKKLTAMMRCWWRAVVDGGRVRDEVRDEFEFHIEARAEELERGGMSTAEARRRARVEMGMPEVQGEKYREAIGLRWVDEASGDLRHALRMLWRSKGFAIVAIASLALGIGASTAIFTLVQQVMLRRLPVERPDQLWRVGDSDECCYSAQYAPGDWNFFSWEAYRYFRVNTAGFAELAAFQPGEGNAELGVRRAGSAEQAEANNGEYVSGNFFRTLGVAAWRGRLLTDADDVEGAAPVAVMSFRTWQEKYGADPAVVGGTYLINGHAFTMIGVTPPGFFGAKIDAETMPDMWLPLTSEPVIAGGTSRLKDARVGWLDLIGRVRPGTDVNALQAQMRAELHQWLAGHVAEMTAQERPVWERQTLRLTRGGAGVSPMRERYGESLRLLMMAALCVLLVACANVANLLLARGLRDRKQMAVRAALGASRARLVRKAVIESLALSVLGAAAGVGVAYAVARLI